MVALTGLPTGYSVIVTWSPYRIECNSRALIGLLIGYSFNSGSNKSPYRIECTSSFNRSPNRQISHKLKSLPILFIRGHCRSIFANP